MSCRNSRSIPESVRKKIAEGVKKNGYIYSEEWKENVAKSNRSDSKIQKVKETWKGKRNYETAHLSSLKKWYLEDVDSCEGCGISEWNGKQIVLEVHHIDSDTSNNKVENLKALCPNCHSMTEGWRNRN